MESKKPIRKEGSTKYCSREVPVADFFTKGKLRPDKRIEQNQKIVDEIIQSYRSLVKDGAFNDVHEVEFSIAQELKRIIEKSTSKDIQDL